jgi:thiol-disulfide isomerase/thioredoxin
MKISALIYFLLAAGCTANTQSNNNIQKSTTEGAEQPLPFPVYTSFAELEPLLTKNNDTTYVVNFWATWCKPCIAELPYFEQLNKNFASRPVKVLLVSLDFAKQIKTTLLPFVEQRKMQSAVAVLIDPDYNTWIDKVSRDWDGTIPFTLIYKGGKRLSLKEEMPDYPTLEQHLLTVLE